MKGVLNCFNLEQTKHGIIKIDTDYRSSILVSVQKLINLCAPNFVLVWSPEKGESVKFGSYRNFKEWYENV